MALKLAIVAILAVLGVVMCEVSRSGSGRYAFVELPRFEDCGMDVQYSPHKTTEAGSHAACAMKCLSNSLCKSSEYDIWNKTCNLYTVTILDKLEEKFGHTYADLTDSNPNVGIIHPCQTDPCNPGQLCREKCGPYGYLCECPEGMTGSNCNKVAPVNGKYTEWYDFSECSATCVITAYRNCTNPAPLAGGKDCEGVNTRYEECAEECSVYPQLGCFLPSSLAADVGPIYDESNDLDACATYCAENGFRIFGAKKRNCYCKRNWDPTNDHDGTKCGAKCPGDSSQICGGSSYVSVYSTGGPYRGCFGGQMDAGAVEVGASVEWEPTTPNPPTTPASTADPTTVAPTVAASGNLTGNDTQQTVAQTTVVTTLDPTTVNPTTTLPSMTVEDCRYACAFRGFLYASLSGGYVCTCHNLLTGLTLDKSEASCDVECTGGDSGGSVCGGSGAYSVFETDVYGVNEWTDWLDIDDPDDGWDDELVSDHQSTYPWICTSPLDIQCQTQDGVPHYETNQTLSEECTLDGGLSCSNEELGVWVNVTYNVTSYEIVLVNVTENATSLVCNLVPYTAPNTTDAAAPTNPQPTASSGNATVTESSATTAQPMILECTNVTGEVVVRVPVNTSSVEGHYRTVNIPGLCEDYQVRYLCKREVGSHIGCFDDTEVATSSNTNLPNLTPDDCKLYCSAGGYRLAAMQSSANLCSCSNSLTALPIQSDKCSLTCSSLPCGGSSYKSVYLTECNVNLGVSTNNMEGTKLHNNDGSDEYGTWYTTITGGDIALINYTNADSQMDLVLKIDLQEERTVSLIKTDGMYVSGEELHGGVDSFYVGYQHDADHDVEFYMDHGAHAATLFTVADLTSATEHKLNRLITARFLYIYVLTYEYFPGLKIELKGCAAD